MSNSRIFDNQIKFYEISYIVFLRKQKVEHLQDIYLFKEYAAPVKRLDTLWINLISHCMPISIHFLAIPIGNTDIFISYTKGTKQYTTKQQKYRFLDQFKFIKNNQKSATQTEDFGYFIYHKYHSNITNVYQKYISCVSKFRMKQKFVDCKSTQIDTRNHMTQGIFNIDDLFYTILSSKNSKISQRTLFELQSLEKRRNLCRNKNDNNVDSKNANVPTPRKAQRHAIATRQALAPGTVLHPQEQSYIGSCQQAWGETKREERGRGGVIRRGPFLREQRSSVITQDSPRNREFRTSAARWLQQPNSRAK